jgi:hypothetical protein
MDILKNFFTTDIVENGKKKQRKLSIHRLVAAAFLPNPDGHPEVNHKNLNRADNNLNNLEWMSKSDQGLSKNKGHIKYINNKRRINQLDLDGNFIKTWDSVADARKNNKGDINSVLSNRRETAAGFKWEYFTEEDLTNEVWKTLDVPEYRTIKVSSCGRINDNGKIMNGCDHKSGYLRKKWKNDEKDTYEDIGVHILVCMAFHGIPENYKDLHVNHKDHDPHNNNASNLEWYTPKENATHKFTTNSKSLFSVLFNEFAINKYSKDNIFIARYKSVQEANKHGNTKYFSGNMRRGIKDYMEEYSNDRSVELYRICNFRWTFEDPDGALEAYNEDKASN